MDLNLNLLVPIIIATFPACAQPLVTWTRKE
jgi:hypothetical protein